MLKGFLALPNELLAEIVEYVDFHTLPALARAWTRIGLVTTDRLCRHSVEDRDGYPALCWAAKGGYFPLVKDLIDRQMPLDRRDERSRSALHCAAEYRRPDIVRLLLDSGADYTILTELGQTVLHSAALCPADGVSEEMFHLLAGLYPPDPRNYYEETPLLVAAYSGTQRMAELLLNAGADINAQNNQGKSALFLSRKEPFLRMLVERGADFNLQDKCGRRPLHLMAVLGAVDVGKMILDRGADINARNDNNWNALHFAVKNGEENFAKMLLVNGVDINVKDDADGAAPLHIAVSRYTHRITEILLENGADINIRDNSGYTPLRKAAAQWQINLEAIKVLLRYGADIETQPNGGWAILHCAADRGLKELAELIIGKGAIIDKENKRGYTALGIAIKNRKGEIEELLLQAGANINFSGKNGNTQLHHAVIRGNLVFAEALVARGANKDARNSMGQSPRSLSLQLGPQWGSFRSIART